MWTSPATSPRGADEPPAPAAAGGSVLALPPALYVFAFATVPLGLLLLYSFYRADFVAIVKEPSLANYAAVLGSATYRALMLKALGYGVTVAAITAVIAYPFAFFVAKRVRVLKAALLTLMLIPLYTGDLIRIFAWRGPGCRRGAQLAAALAGHRGADLGAPVQPDGDPLDRAHLQLPAVHGYASLGVVRGLDRSISRPPPTSGPAAPRPSSGSSCR